jgi:hypothetical protein
MPHMLFSSAGCVAYITFSTACLQMAELAAGQRDASPVKRAPLIQAPRLKPISEWRMHCARQHGSTSLGEERTAQPKAAQACSTSVCPSSTQHVHIGWVASPPLTQYQHLQSISLSLPPSSPLQGPPAGKRSCPALGAGAMWRRCDGGDERAPGTGSTHTSHCCCAVQHAGCGGE